MIYTSYFAKLKKLPSNYIPISICGKAPDWYTGLQYKVLAPKWSFFKIWKENHDNDFYIKHFKEEVIDRLDYKEVLKDLYNKLSKEDRDKLNNKLVPFWMNEDVNIVLICYEKPDDFCHRHLISKWFNDNGIIVDEFRFE